MRTRIIIEHNGRRYRVGNRTGCDCKRDCDLFQLGVCDGPDNIVRFPCNPILEAFERIGCSCPEFCFKEVK